MHFIILFKHCKTVPTPEVDSVVVGCETDQECPDYNACQNRKCINPCAEDDPCAPSANCKVIGHQPVCTCPDGYIGDPRTECKLRKHTKFMYIAYITLITTFRFVSYLGIINNPHYFCSSPT